MTAQLSLLDAPSLAYVRDAGGLLHLRLGGELLPAAVFEDSSQRWLAVLLWRTDDGVEHTTLGPHASRNDAGQAAFAAFLGLVNGTEQDVLPLEVPA